MGKIIESTLENLCFYIPFDYWVICDTGSSDNTQFIIRDFFQNKGISGELIENRDYRLVWSYELIPVISHNQTDLDD